jgi:integrase
VILARVAERAGVPGVHPHKFRHTFATMALRAHAREIDVQSLLGHSSLTMVQRYARTYSSEQAVAAHSSFSPVAQLTG